jgi:hypothetical protein
MENNDEYNVKNFTDEELFHLMDLNNPTDRELEAKLYMLIEKYEGNKNKLSVKMCKFFNDVFSHFFSTDDDDNEGFETQYKLENEIQKTALSAPIAPLSTVASNYSKGLLNPLLKETIKRIVCVDSQYRDLSVYSNPANFTFNLSDTLTDVVSLKLYSVQIPYTWYTISNDFGSNFFILKGNNEGIDNGNFDFKVEIQSGNYQSNELQTYLNKSLTTIFSKNSDFDFGSTLVSYDNINSKLTLKLDIKLLYNESNYQLEFFDPSSNFFDPSSNIYNPVTDLIPKKDNVITSIPELLGYKYNNYYPFSTVSSENAITSLDQICIVDDNNNYFNIYIYQGVINDGIIANSTSQYLETIKIKLSIFGSKKLSEIVENVNTQLISSPFIDSVNSKLYYDVQLERFKFKIRLNRKEVINGKNMKTAIGLPNSKLWITTLNDKKEDISAFKFKTTLFEINQIESNTDYLRTQYKIPDTEPVPKLSFVYKNKIYARKNRIVYISPGDYKSIEVQNQINYKLRVLKDETKDVFDCSFNISESKLPVISCKIKEIIPYCDSSMNKNFKIGLSNSFFKKFFNFKEKDLNEPASSLDQKFEESFESGDSLITIPIKETGKVLEDDFIKISMVDYFSDMRIDVLKPGTYTLEAIQRETNIFFNKDENNTNNVSFKGSSISIVPADSSTSTFKCTLILKITVVFTNKDFDLDLIDTNSNMWYDFFGFQGQEYNTDGIPQYDSTTGNRKEYDSKGIPHYSSGVLSYNLSGDRKYDLSKDLVLGTFPIPSNLLKLTKDNNSFSFVPVIDTNGGVYSTSKKHKITITLTLDLGKSYAREEIMSNINSLLRTNEILYGSYVSEKLGKTVFKVNINKIFTAQDYRIVFFDNTFTRCNFGMSSIDNVKWDTTLGWILGFRNQTQYVLTKSNESNSMNDLSSYYTDYPNQSYIVDSDTNIVKLTGDTSINVNLYNYLLVVLDDYCQNHLNDGLVTVTKTDYDIPLPSYANRTTYQCDASGQLSIVNGKLTTKQLYSANQILNTKQINQKQNVYSSGPFTQDIFALVPIKTAGLSPGQSFVEFGGTLQNQERTYFGPVNIRKMTIQLLNDKGSTLDLNGANWSFSFIAEQLYNPSRN